MPPTSEVEALLARPHNRHARSTHPVGAGASDDALDTCGCKVSTKATAAAAVLGGAATLVARRRERRLRTWVALTASAAVAGKLLGAQAAATTARSSSRLSRSVSAKTGHSPRPEPAQRRRST